MKTIFKYQPTFDDRIEIMAPEDSQLLDVQIQGGRLTFWYLVDPQKPLRPYNFAIFGTGHPVDIADEDFRHVATVQEMQGQLVWHIFEL
jgi:hypothetical protein